MEFIIAEVFLSQPEEIQQVFIEWWKPSIGDLFAWNFSDERENDLHKMQCCTSELVVNITKRSKGIKEGDRIPLFTEGQLRKFIEDKAECKLEIEINNDHTYDIFIERFNNAYFEYKGKFKHLNTDLLKSYWKIACEIAKEY